MGNEVDLAREHNFLNEILTKIQELETDEKVKQQLLTQYKSHAAKEDLQLDKKLLESVLIDLLLKNYQDSNEVISVRLPDTMKMLNVKDLVNLQKHRIAKKLVDDNQMAELGSLSEGEETQEQRKTTQLKQQLERLEKQRDSALDLGMPIDEYIDVSDKIDKLNLEIKLRGPHTGSKISNIQEGEIATLDNADRADSKILKKPTHNPKLLVGLLNKFTQETPLKYSTHFWENNGYNGYDSFVEELTNAFDEYLAKTIMWLDFKQGFYYQVLFPFLRQNKLMKNQKDEDYKWGRHKFKLGWQYPTQFWKNLSNEQKEWPFSVALPPEYRPEKRIDGVRVLKFNDLIEFFKKEIEFRRSDFRDELQKLVTHKTDWNFKFINIESVDFYTYTTKILSAISRMIANLDRSFTECEFEVIDEKDCYIFRFTQIGSFRNVALSNLGKIDISSKKGDFFSIYKELFGFCDWSIANKFRDAGYVSISYLGEGATVEPKILEKSNLDESEAPEGFTHYLKFYK